MNIAHIVCRFPPYPSGMGAVAFEQVKRLAVMGHSVTVFTLPQKPRLDSNKLPFDIEYFFLQLRGKSVGDEITVELPKPEEIDCEEYARRAARELGIDEKTLIDELCRSDE